MLVHVIVHAYLHKTILTISNPLSSLSILTSNIMLAHETVVIMGPGINWR